MTPTIGDDELRIGRRLRRLVDGPTADDAAREHAAGHPDTPADSDAHGDADGNADSEADTPADTAPAGSNADSAADIAPTAASNPPAAPTADTGTGHAEQATVRRPNAAHVRRAPARPDGLPRGAGRYPDWRRGDLADLTPAPPANTPPSATPDTPGTDTPNTPKDTAAQGHRRIPPLKAAPEPTPTEPPADNHTSDKPGPGADTTQRLTPTASWAHHDLADDGRLRFLLFNGTAAGAGYTLGLVPSLERYLPASARSATATIGAVLALVAAVLMWRFTRIPWVRDYLPKPQITRVIVTAVTAEIARRFAPVAVTYPDRYGTRYGLDAHAASLLLTCGGLAFGLWWLIDRRTTAARWWWGARWIARIPLASVVLATALYAPGNTV